MAALTLSAISGVTSTWCACDSSIWCTWRACAPCLGDELMVGVASGRGAARFGACRAALRDELVASPSPQTEAVYLEMLRAGPA